MCHLPQKKKKKVPDGVVFEKWYRKVTGKNK